MRRSSNVFTKDLELETIPEGSEIQLTLASPQRRINIEMNEKKIEEDCLDQDDQPNLHGMTKMELLNVQRTAKEDKKQFRRWLKEKEAKFLEENGRIMPKDDLKDTDYYSKYKMTKAKLKLVDALLSKFVKWKKSEKTKKKNHSDFSQIFFSIQHRLGISRNFENLVLYSKLFFFEN